MSDRVFWVDDLLKSDFKDAIKDALREVLVQETEARRDRSKPKPNLLLELANNLRKRNSVTTEFDL